jgi:hypothetical protein
MNRKEFNEQMARLISVYGQNKYPVERLDMIFRAVNAISLEHFENQVSEFIGSSDKPPLMQDFRNALAGLLTEAIKKLMETKLVNIPSCLNCDNTGHARMYEKDTGFEFAFQCTCERGKILCRSFPIQYSGMSEKFVSHRMWSSSRWSRLDAARNYYKKNNPVKPTEIKGMSRPDFTLSVTMNN